MVLQKENKFIFYAEHKIKKFDKFNVIIHHLTPESNFVGKILDLELDMWYTHLYEFITK
jgi:hypothetical protein